MWISWIFDFSTNFAFVWLHRFYTEKNWRVIFNKDLSFAKNHVFFFLKKQGAPTKVGFTIFLWNFAHVLYVGFFFFFLHLLCFLKIYRFRKDIIFLTFFVGIAQENTYSKFQRKTINSAELEPLEILIVLNKRTSFW